MALVTPEYKGTSVNTSGAVWTKPTGTVEGDLMLVMAYRGSGGDPSLPSGWTQIGSSIANGSGMQLWAYKVHGDEASTTTFTFTNADYVDGVVWAGIDVVDPIGNSTIAVITPTTTTPTLSAFTCESGDAVVAGHIVSWTTVVTYTQPSGFTERSDANGIAWSDKRFASGGSTGSVVWTASGTDEFSAMIVELKVSKIATRLYFDSVALPPLTPNTFCALWEDVGGSATHRMNLRKGSSAYANISRGEAVTTSAYDVCCRRGVIGPLETQTLTGSFKCQVRASESDVAMNAIAQIAIKIIKPDRTDRGVAYAGHSSTATDSEFTVAGANRMFPSAVLSRHMTDVSVIYGDFLVVELGYRANNTSATSYTGTIRTGQSASDHLEEETSTADNSPWIQFDSGLLFTEEMLLDRYKYQRRLA